MSDSLGRFVIDLEARTAALESDLGRAARIAEQQARAMQKSFEDGFAKIGEAAHKGTEGLMDALNSLTGLSASQLGIGAIVAGLGELTKTAIETGDQLNKMAQRTGIGVTALSGLTYAGSLADVQMGDLGVSLEKFAKTTAAAAGGSKEQAAAFQAIGLSVKSADGSIRPLDELLGDVAGKFAGYKDGVEKTALAQALFGKSGAALIPLLNQGKEGLAATSAEAKALGYNFGDIAGSSEEFNDNLTRLGKAAVGLGADIARELLPSFIDAEQAVLDFIKSTRETGTVNTVLTAVADGFSQVWIVVKALGVEAYNLATDDTLGKFLTTTKNELQAIVDLLPKIDLNAPFRIEVSKPAFMDTDWFRWLNGTNPGGAMFDRAAKEYSANANAQAQANPFNGIDTSSIKTAFSGLIDVFDGAIKGADEFGLHVQQSGEAAKKTAPNVSGLGSALKDASDEAAKAAQALLDQKTAMDALSKLVTSIQGKAGTPYDDSAAKYANALLDVQAAAEKAAIAGSDFADILPLWQAGEKAAADQLVKTNLAISQQDDVLGRFLTETANKDALLGLSDSESAVAQAVAKVTDEYNKNVEAGKPMKDSLATVQAGAAEAEKAFQAHSAAVKNNEEVAREWVGVWSSATDSISNAFAKFLVEGGSLFDSLRSIAKQTVEAIIQYFAKLAVINPILNSVFGVSAGGGSLLPTLANAAVSAAGSGGASSYAGFGAGVDFSSTAGGGTQNSLFSGSSWVGYGKSLYQGFSSGFNASSAASSNLFGSYVPDAGTGVYTPSTLGYGTAIAGGVYAGYNRFQNSNKDFGGAVGGVAYGVGAYSAALGAGAALSGGAAAGLAAVPVVGWIALAAIAVDMLSGGKLFGTGKKVTGGDQQLNFSNSGVDVATELQVKGQKAFFGGATFGTKDIPTSPEAIAAANDFFAQLRKGTDDFAKQFGLKAGTVVDSAFQTQFDKKGNPTGKTRAWIGGVEYDNETQEQFATRLQAENFTADLKQAGVDITGYTAQYIKDADSLSQAVQDAAAAMQLAQQDIKAGIQVAPNLQGDFDLSNKYNTDNEGLSATYQRLSAETQDLKNGIDLLTGQKTISAIEDFLAESMKVGETLTQTYVRLQQAGAAYTQFIGQFKPQATYVDDFEASLANLRATELANIKQANDLAKAAGLEGASTKDLVNIHKYAAQQFAALVQQLENSAQANAYALGLSPAGTLDQINQQISDLEGQSSQAASAVQNFGGAMQQAAQTASDSINLLLGDLSPLNDQQKLQTALQGLYAGTVTQEQVLEIGRRLYATGQQYTNLFNTVSQYAPHPTASGGYSGGGAQSPTGTAGLTQEQQKQLKDLYAQRGQLQAQSQYQQAQVLAQQIAEISSAKGEDVQKAIDDLGIKNADLEKALHLDSDAQLKAYIENAQKQVDSNGDNSQSIVDAIQQLGADLINALGVRPDNYVPPTRPTGGTGRTGSSNRGGGDSGASNDAIDRLVRNTQNLVDGLARSVVPQNRGNRTGVLR